MATGSVRVAHGSLCRLPLTFVADICQQRDEEGDFFRAPMDAWVARTFPGLDPVTHELHIKQKLIEMIRVECIVSLDAAYIDRC